MPWLLAIVVTSTPAARSAWKAVGGARKVKLFGSGVPRVVIAVSRLTIARSALDSTEATGPRAVSRSAAKRVPSMPSKCVSPPKAMEMTGGGDAGLVVADVPAGAGWAGPVLGPAVDSA